MEQIQRKPQIAILAFLMSLANVLGVMYVAALPELTQYFQITKTEAQETISLYLAGCFLAQGAYPALTKALGRKPTIYIGGSLTILGSILCLISIQIHSFPLLLFGRGLTAFGAACGAILTSTIVAESFSATDTRKALSYLMSVFVIFPSIGVTMGGFLTKYITWESCFYFMLLYSIFVVCLCILLPETSKEKGLGHLHILRIGRAYIRQFSNLTAVLYGLIIACAAIILYVFSAEAPFIAKNLNISADLFGLYNLIPNLGFFLGGMSSVYLSHKVSSKNLIFIGVSIFFLFSILMWGLFDTGFVTSVVLFGAPFLIFLASAIILPNGQACALATSDDKPYMASILYMIQYFWVTLSIIALGFFPADDPSVLPIMYSCSGILMLLLWFAIKKTQRTTRA